MNDAPSRPVRVLLIDDDPYMLKLLSLQLKNLGFADIISFEHAEQAVKLLQTDAAAVGLIFCDLQMPGMDGIEFLRQFAGLCCNAGVVLVSGESERILHAAETLAVAHRINILGVLKKPVSLQQLRVLALSDGPPADPSRKRPKRVKSYSAEEIHQGIRDGQLINYYQPQVHIRSGELVGVETLVRWRHPDDGLIFPDQFIGIAEEHELIHDLTNAVLIAALAQASAWRLEGLSLQISVNVSMRNLTRLQFPDFVAEAADRAGVPRASLVLEVTENQLMNNRRAALEILTRLQLKRIHLSIDDFGTGHSSLAQLRDIPFDELKVDRGFVHRAAYNSSLRAIFDACISMARQLGLRTVAEGVEDADDWNFLRATRCDVAQGYFLAKPMEAADLPGWLAGWRERFRQQQEQSE